ncbi:uncharacterized protein LOC131186789 [Ahaetulla prasina]|uniref:uncharacterized protein LOC131186789 n=1 Tax=Ahaetulla prasina TaxID=499056 RepID=UPI00264739EB|nr:uncharacterized protein LOC131186789 [Ahaetulla prasina]
MAPVESAIFRGGLAKGFCRLTLTGKLALRQNSDAVPALMRNIGRDEDADGNDSRRTGSPEQPFKKRGFALKHPRLPMLLNFGRQTSIPRIPQPCRDGPLPTRRPPPPELEDQASQRADSRAHGGRVDSGSLKSRRLKCCGEKILLSGLHQPVTCASPRGTQEAADGLAGGRAEQLLQGEEAAPLPPAALLQQTLQKLRRLQPPPTLTACSPGGVPGGEAPKGTGGEGETLGGQGFRGLQGGEGEGALQKVGAIRSKRFPPSLQALGNGLAGPGCKIRFQVQ